MDVRPGLDAGQVLAIVLPLLLIQVALLVIALRDLLRPERQVRGGNKLLWAIVICFGELLGPVLYFAIGRLPE